MSQSTPRSQPVPEGRTGIAMSINPDAGTHPVSADPRELAAVRRATERSLERFPYFTARYGERALRFGDSDGAWMALVAHMDPSYVVSQSLWLASVLASRGMPTLLLEEHLRFLRQELQAALPEHAGRYAQLDAAADALRDRRETGGDPGRMTVLAAEFGERPGADRGPSGFGEILVAAVADERSGLPGTLAEVQTWARERHDFGGEWVAAVDDTLAAAARVPASG
ncbi:hypothetical protein [Longimicrobium terrae]|uniref:Uncharacterized protein n=1 Tax=Longimicrobium terrae TaxID=1639882 RepID=A0A841GQ99_9BACT|nr:hypothetical protein [Longimicrobium terrae]MBB4635228.1 hypothetical protein [Longimicrobium terrae]MBB6069622.1 hypothetical protein [Longimicrobium terrae]NNC31577.1 hypothetical protein [Longimicrobium terrae]